LCYAPIFASKFYLVYPFVVAMFLTLMLLGTWEETWGTAPFFRSLSHVESNPLTRHRAGAMNLVAELDAAEITLGPLFAGLWSTKALAGA
jgi:hypothetical protein